MKQPLLVDKRLNMFLDENTSVFFNPSEINLIEVKRATMPFEKENGEKEEIDGHAIFIYTKKEDVSKNTFFCNNEEGLKFLERNAKVVNFVVVHIDPNNGNRTYLNKNNILQCNLTKRTKEEIADGKKEVLLSFRFETGVDIHQIKKQIKEEINRDNIRSFKLDSLMEKTETGELKVKEGKEEEYQKYIEEIKNEEFSSEEVLSKDLYYQVEFDLKEELKEYDEKGELNHYTIMDDFLNSLAS